MGVNYAFKYAIVREDKNGICVEIQDTTDYVIDRLHVPIEDDSLPYLMKYYFPIPDTVTSFDDFHGMWYTDAAHTILAEGLN